jgi:NAD-dependent dihydropyrimidine dehydrogenase PreA subunit
MIRTLLNLGSETAAPRVAKRTSAEPRQVSRRDFLTFGRGRHCADGMWRVSLDANRCTDCQACVRVCGTEALRRTDNDARIVYSLALASCNGCGDCKAVCAVGAVTVFRAADSRQQAVEIATLAKKVCKRCGRLEAGVIDGVCPVCQTTNGLWTLRS